MKLGHLGFQCLECGGLPPLKDGGPIEASGHGKKVQFSGILPPLKDGGPIEASCYAANLDTIYGPSSVERRRPH